MTNRDVEDLLNPEELVPLENDNFDDLLKSTPITKDTACGIWCFKGDYLQKFANKKIFIIIYGISGLFCSSYYAYYNGTITTIEKRYKIPSRNTGIISVGVDVSLLFVSAAVSYYAGKGHRPRWMAFGLMIMAISCICCSLPHFIYGPGEDALLLTTEYNAKYNENATLEMLEQEELKEMCTLNATTIADCEVEESNLGPQIILFAAQMLAGLGEAFYYSIGVAYMDDNIKKSKTPALISLTFFVRLLGPALGYTIVSFCLKMYIAPNLSPTITIQDPRWLGAWWIGWIILAICTVTMAFPLSLVPKEMPRTAVRKILEDRKRKKENKNKENVVEEPPSFKDMIVTFKRVLKNKTLLCNNIASIFQFFASVVYWIFTPKYIEIQYKQSASLASLVTGTVAIAFSALGIVVSGFVITKFKPRARSMAAWNVFVGALSVMGMLSYTYLDCSANDNTLIINKLPGIGEPDTCSSNCHCDYVKYSPVCGEDNFTYISACHAGCSKVKINGSKHYENCSCVSPSKNIFETGNENYSTTNFETSFINRTENYGKAFPGSCPVDCFNEFIIFLSVMCINQFIGASGRATNFLVAVRCVDEKDKTVSMGLGLMLLCLFAFIPSPILFGMLFDSTCLVWGKTCSGTGNCWLYDGQALRYLINITAASCVFIGTLLDTGVWYFVKDLKIFDDENETEMAEFIKKDKQDIVETN